MTRLTVVVRPVMFLVFLLFLCVIQVRELLLKHPREFIMKVWRSLKKCFIYNTTKRFWMTIKRDWLEIKGRRFLKYLKRNLTYDLFKIYCSGFTVNRQGARCTYDISHRRNNLWCWNCIWQSSQYERTRNAALSLNKPENTSLLLALSVSTQTKWQVFTTCNNCFPQTGDHNGAAFP